ncbi:MAG TPA: hypothetical protein PKI71_16880, partial [Candidatus Rifleibacterium sp.]|nr:hypothetical protein [Candidatus Rifleibacterium sp.]
VASSWVIFLTFHLLLINCNYFMRSRASCPDIKYVGQIYRIEKINFPDMPVAKLPLNSRHGL